MAPRKLVEPWDTEKAASLAADALRYLASHYPECAASEVLRPHEEAAHEAAMDADEVRYREALRALKGDVTMAGTSGFTTREDIVLCTKPSEGPSESLHKNPSTTTKGA